MNTFLRMITLVILLITVGCNKRNMSPVNAEKPRKTATEVPQEQQPDINADAAPTDQIDKLLQQAEAFYQARQKDKVKEAYLKAAELGSAEAHFQLTWRCTLPYEEDVKHVVAASRMGHEKAVDHMLDMLLFRAGSIRRANPELAISTYKDAMKANPNLKIPSESLKTLERLADAPAFDVGAFMKTYKIKEPDPELTGDYGVWELAEEASRGGRFGKPNPELAFQLIIHGGFVPAEYWAAVEWAHRNWKENKNEEFVIDRYVTSGIGSSFCTHRRNNVRKEYLAKRVQELKEWAPVKSHDLLDKAYAAAYTYLLAKSEKEEGHGGSWRYTWQSNSFSAGIHDYLKFLEKAQGGWVPSFSVSYDVSDRRLNAVYKNARSKVNKEEDLYDAVKPDGFLAVQRLWIPHRDATAEYLASATNTEVVIWKHWLTDERTKQLGHVVKYGSSIDAARE